MGISKRFTRALVAAAVLLGAAGVARADEPLFGYIYTTDTLPKGKAEIEHWDTLREGRSQGDFHVLQDRTEYSYGLTDKLQVSGYLNLAWTDTKGNIPSGDTAPPEIFADYNANPNKPFNHGRLESVSGEVIYRVLSPYTDPIGLALYVEPSVGPRTVELENRLILQKNFLDDRLVIAANATLGFEWRRLHGDPSADPTDEEFIDHWDKETDVNFGVAVSYRFARNWSFAGEFQNEREWGGLNPFDSKNRTNIAYYAGPTIHYAGGHYFFTGTVLFQLPLASDLANPPADTFVVHGISNADDFEKYRFRFKAGYYF
jgi:hypothetical protein